MNRLKLTILLIFLSGNVLYSQDLLKDIASGFELGKAELITAGMIEEVELITPESEGLCSKDMAQKRLGKFFSTHKSKKFHLVHQGKSPSGLTYHIGELDTDNGEFRIYVLLSGKGAQKISELRIEEDD